MNIINSLRICIIIISSLFLMTNCSPGKKEQAAPAIGVPMERIGQSNDVSYVCYTANNGDLYYVDYENGNLHLMKYVLAAGTTVKIKENFAANMDSADGFGMIAPSADGNTVYCLTTPGNSAEIWRLTCSDDRFEKIAQICGTNWWKIFNLTLSRDEKSLYFISINNSLEDKNKWIYKIDLTLNPPQCSPVLDINNVIVPDRDLCFGGVNVWDKNNNFYAPVWKYTENSTDDTNIALLQVNVNNNQYSANLIYFTDTGTASGASLYPGFRHASCWSAIGASSDGSIYIAISNHIQPLKAGDIHGNVAIYKYDTSRAKMFLLGDLQTVSSGVNNWMAEESQFKVHTFITQHSDGNMYFASLDYEPTFFLRGSHLYSIDTRTDTIYDYSKTQPYVMLRDFSVIPNGITASSTSGIFIEYYGIKGIALNPGVPDLMYMMLYSSPEKIGHIVKYIMP